MKKLFTYIGITSIFLFSFYYTEKVSSIVINNSSLVMKINENSSKFNILPVSAEINGDYIVPGINGTNVNVLKSYNNMKALEVFNSYYLEYDKVLPEISLENNKDKIIKNGNSLKNAVSVILKDNVDLINYSKEKNIKITRLVNYDTFDKLSSNEQINDDIEKYKSVEKMLNGNNLNKNICVINKNNLDLCKENNKYLVEPTHKLYNYNLANIKSNIKSGNIIYINDDINLTDYKILIRQIYYQDLDIIPLSKLITEQRD